MMDAHEAADASVRPPPGLLAELLAAWDRKTTAPDLVLQARIAADIAQGLAVPQWSWPIPGPYNGASGAERIRGWQVTKIALQRGWLDARAGCSICQASSRVQRHSELYGRPLLAKPICRDCHFGLHRRFREPEVWVGFCERHPGARWIRRIGLAELTRAQARELEAQPNPLGLLDP